MGVPVVTLYGNRYAGRMAASALTALGLTELIARSPEEYVDVAARWVGDVDRLARLRTGSPGEIGGLFRALQRRRLHP